MPIATRLLSAHRRLGTLSQGICQYDLADAARAADLQGGRVLQPRFAESSNHLPYVAARPVAEHVRGARQVTLKGAALRGASMAVSFVRSDVPAMASFAALFWSPDAVMRGLSGGKKRQPVAALPGSARALAASLSLPTLIGLAPWALGCWETVLGSGTRQEFQARALDAAQRGVPAVPDGERWRRVGLVGLVESSLIGLAAKAHDRDHMVLEAAVLSGAVGLRLAVLPLRQASVGLVTCVAVVGAALGVLVGAASNLAFVLRKHVASLPFGDAEVISLREAQERQELVLAHRPRVADRDNDELPLPLALWKNRVAPQKRFNNEWTQLAVTISALLCVQTFVEEGIEQAAARGTNGLSLLNGWNSAFLLANLVAAAMTFQANPWAALAGRDEPLPPLPADRGAAPLPGGFRQPRAAGAHWRAVHPQWPLGRLGPRRGLPAERELANEHRRGVDVHERGRDPAMRQSLSNLLRRYPVVDVGLRIRQLSVAILERELEPSPISLRVHAAAEAGTVLQAAQRVLGVGPADRLQREEGILSSPQARAIQLAPGSVVSLKTVVATVWHAIAQLQDPRGEAFNLVMRRERSDALLLALADCIDEGGHLVCTPGQAQRIMLVLQGFVEEVAIDNFAAAPTVAEFVTGAYRHIARDLQEDAPPAAVRARFHAAYADGMQALPRHEHARLLNELATLLRMDHDLTWNA